MAKKTEGTQAGYEQLKKDLAQKQPGRFYIFYGEEDYLRRHYLSMLKKQLLDELTEDFNYHRLTQENLSAQLLYDSIEAIPMMSERSLVQVDDVDLFLLPEAERNKIAETLSASAETRGIDLRRRKSNYISLRFSVWDVVFCALLAAAVAVGLIV